VAEFAESPVASPLSSDHELFQMYMNALDVVLGAPDVRRSFDEFGLSAGILRIRMVNEAPRVLRTAAREFTVYETAVANELTARTADPTVTGQEKRWSVARWQRVLTHRLGLGAWGFSHQVDAARDRLMTAITETELLAQVRTYINTARQSRFGHAYSVSSSPALSEVYDSANKVPIQIESELAELLDRLDGASIGVAGPRGAGKSTLIRGYCEKADSLADDLDGIAWSSLLGSSLPERSWGDLRCMAAAPVDYVARDFVLHLFATFCRTVIASYSDAGRFRGVFLSAFWLRRIGRLCMSLLWLAFYYGGCAAILLHWNKDIARRTSVPAAWVQYAGIALIAAVIVGFAWSSAGKITKWAREARSGRESGRAMLATARKHLSRVRYLQTYTSGLSGGLTLPGGARTQISRSVSRAEQPLSYPEIVAEFRNFASSVAADVHRRGDRVFIGVDELDKIGSAEQAERFLNEVKGIFGIQHLYFMVSVSDDALNAFERRGLPLRDAFDSSFDEILRVEPLNYSESRRMLYRRVIGLTEPYVAFCHCLAGGLARDVIRAARQVARNAAKLTTGRPDLMASRAAESGSDSSTEYELLDDVPSRDRLTLSAISAAVLYDEMHRKLRAISHVVGRISSEDTAELQNTLHDIAAHLVPGQPIIAIVDLIAKPGYAESPAVTRIRLDLVAYAYYSATLQEVFTDRLDDAQMVKATSESSGPASFDALATARNAFTTDTLLAWHLVSQCRHAWSLEAHEPPGTQVQQGDGSRPDTQLNPPATLMPGHDEEPPTAAIDSPATTRSRGSSGDSQSGGRESANP
jgi:hypothetical protein